MTCPYAPRSFRHFFLVLLDAALITIPMARLTAYPLPLMEHSDSTHSTAYPTSSSSPPPLRTVILYPSMLTFGGYPRVTLTGDISITYRSPSTWTLTAIGAAYAGTLIAVHLIQHNAWWKVPGPFQVVEDWNYALQVDKAGHIYGGYLMSYLGGEFLLAAGMDIRAAATWGALLGLLYQTYVEVEDGFSRDWGFSPTDAAANFIGAYWYLAQHYCRPLQAFQPRWQYIPARWTGDLPRRHSGTFIDDYNSSTFWLAIDVYQLLPAEWQRYYPPWLMVALGYGVRNVDTELPKTRRMMLGIDYNLRLLLPDGPPIWKWLRQSLALLKLPAPAIELGPHPPRLFLLYPFRPRLR